MSTSTTNSGMPTIGSGALLRGEERFRIYKAMEEKGLKDEARLIKGDIEALQAGATLEHLFAEFKSSLAVNTEVLRGVKDTQADVVRVLSRQTDIEAERLVVDKQKIEADRAAQDATAAIRKAAAEETAKTERFRIQNRRLVIVAIVTSLGSASGLGALVLALLEKV